MSDKNTIFREQTKEEKEDFIDIGPLAKFDKAADNRIKMGALIDKLNRYQITNSSVETLPDVLKNLSCRKCFQFEDKQGLIDSSDFKKIYKKYQGHRILDKVVYMEHKNRYGDNSHYAVIIRFKPCEYCGGANSICFENYELSAELFELLKKMSQSDIVDDKELFADTLKKSD